MNAPLTLKRTLRQAVTPVARAARRTVLPRVLPCLAHTWPALLRDVRVVGLLSSSSGLGKSARLCMDVFGRAGYGVSGVNVAGLYDSDDGLPFPASIGKLGPAQVSIYHLNPPMLLAGIMRANPLRFLRTFNVGYWAWELETLPREWVETIRFVDAVMVPSSFCKRAVERHTDKPVLVVPHPVPLRAELGPVPAVDCFRVVSIFNFGSSFERKNPLAAVRAFRGAFGSDENAELVLKVSDGAKYPGDRARLMAEIGDAANVRLIDEVWDEARLDGFLASASAYMSLHRSEGFGLTLAEAIAAGVPVLTTNWSGSTDFARPDLCFPVEYDLVPVRDRHLSFADTDGAVWAEPSVVHASIQLRHLRDGQSSARAAALKLRDHLRDHMAARTYQAAIDRLAGTKEAGLGAAARSTVGAER
jgi:glycosyltransferase involved in cell wall biosynthesis